MGNETVFAPTRKQARDILTRWKERALHIAYALGEHFPHIYDPSRQEWATDGGWTEGFWTGVLWQLASYFGDDETAGLAEHYTRLLAERKAGFTDHDLGFLFYHSCVLENLVTGNEEMIGAALAAADRLASRFNPWGGFIRAHGELSDPDRAGYAIVDTAMNLRLLFWAHRTTGERSYYDISRRCGA